MNRLVLGTVTLALALVSSAAVANTQKTHTLEFDPSRIEFIEDAGGVRVDYPTSSATAQPGTPDLPVITRLIEIPAGYRVARVEVTDLVTTTLGEHTLLAAQPDRRAGELATNVSLIATQGVWPEDWVEIGMQGSMRGHQLATLLVHPTRWNAETRELTMATRMTLSLELVPDASATPLQRNRIVRPIEKRFERAMTHVADFEPFAAAGSEPIAGPGPYQPTHRPTTDGSAVEYVIVTNEALESEFQRLADFKTRKGVQAIVKTVEWIDETYPNGADRGERVRFFLKDAYSNWGTLFCLLGGDTDVIPARYATTISPLHEDIPADMYYGCLEGNWNSDGDERWGEGVNTEGSGDDADLFFDVVIGRAPASTVDEATTFVDKVLLYELDAPSGPNGYPPSAIAMAEQLFPANHGANHAETAFAVLPPWWKQVKLYEGSASYPGSIELTAETAVDSLNNGFGLALHVGHGFRNTMSMGAGTISNPDVDGLVNAPRNSVVFAINCSSASIDFNSIGERWLKNPDGGSIIYIGTSRLAFVTASISYQSEWFRTVFVDSVTSIGLATDMARSVLIPGSSTDGSTRWNLTSTTLLGDPEVDIYMNEVLPLSVNHPGSITLGQPNVPITVTSPGGPVEGATVTLWKDGEAYALGETNGAGNVTLDFSAQTTGDALIMAHKGTYEIYDATIPVIASGSGFPYISSMAIDDGTSGPSEGDGDGVVDAGEIIELSLTLRNGGGGTLTSVNGALTVTEDPAGAVNITSSAVSYGSIGAGAASSGSSLYVVEIDASAPEAYQPVFNLAISTGQGNWNEPLALPVHRPYIEHYQHDIDDDAPRGNGDGIVDAGEEIRYTIDLRNSGRDDLSQVSATLEVLRQSDGLPNPDVTLLDGNSNFGSITVGEIKSGDRFAFDVSGGADPTNILLRVTFNAPPFASFEQDLEVFAPGIPDSIRAFGSTSSITLKWRPPTDDDLLGYDVLRASNLLGPYARINEYTVEGSSVFEDRDLPPLTRFYYSVQARDQSYNAGPLSTVVSGTTNPPILAGWPIETGQQSSSSPTVADLDGDYHMEILSGHEMQYAFHADGSEVVDGDDDARSNGPFSLLGRNLDRGFGATQAVGDMDGDGTMEVANVGWTVDSLFVWNHQGDILPNFPKSVLDDFNWASPVMSDLDLDGDLEVICWAGGGGRLFGWHHTGEEVNDWDSNPATDGLMFRVINTSFVYGTPAIGNLDADPEPEIVLTVNKTGTDSGPIYAINTDGTILPGFPVLTGSAGTPSEVSSAPALGDIDNDGDLEIVITAERGGGRVYVIHHDGSIDANFPRNMPLSTTTDRIPSPVLADVDGNNFLDIVIPSTDGELYVLDRFGNSLPNFPVEYATDSGQRTQCTAVVGDVDGDNEIEIVFGDEAGLVHGFNDDGTQVQGFPIQTSGEVRGSPTIWDVDEDGTSDVVVNSFNASIYIWATPFVFRPTTMPWPTFSHDTRNTNFFENDILPIAVDDPGPLGAPDLVVPALHRAVPNPFNPRTEISFDVPGEAGGSRRVALSIYDVAGRRVRTLIDATVETGTHAVVWDGRAERGDLASSGVYFAELRVGSFVTTQKLVMLR